MSEKLHKIPEGPLGPDLYFHPYTGKFFMQEGRNGTYMPVDVAGAKRLLKMFGLKGTADKNEVQSEVEAALADAMFSQAVQYAGAYAGRPAGIIEEGKNLILSTHGPDLIQPVEGEWPMMRGILEELFIPGSGQLQYVYSWMKMALQCMYSGIPMPGQAFIMAGPRRCGKNLIQDRLTDMCGGRVGRPYRYMSGKTEFNADLFQAEHLMISDECPFTDIQSRRLFGTRIKDFAVNQYQSCHGKHRDALILAPCWRLSISLNDEEENINMLPPMDGSIQDKVMLFKVQPAQMPMECASPGGRAKFEAALRAELPAMIHWLLNGWEVPQELAEERFGVQAYQHPDLLDLLTEFSPEARLDELIDTILMGDGTTPVDGTLQQIETRLLEDQVYRSRVEKLLSWPRAFQTYMQRLKKGKPHKYKSTGRNHKGQTKWQIVWPDVK